MCYLFLQKLHKSIKYVHTWNNLTGCHGLAAGCNTPYRYKSKIQIDTTTQRHQTTKTFCIMSRKVGHIMKTDPSANSIHWWWSWNVQKKLAIGSWAICFLFVKLLFPVSRTNVINKYTVSIYRLMCNWKLYNIHWIISQSLFFSENMKSWHFGDTWDSDDIPL